MAEPGSTRREMISAAAKGLVAASAASGLAGVSAAASAAEAAGVKKGDQRLSVQQLQAWEKLGYGMFIHYGMSTYTGRELPTGKDPLETYAPDQLDVDQWISVARDAGMKYAVLTAKHVAGHCLWPTKCTSYSVANSPVKTDVVEAFVKACEKHSVGAGFYYCSWDNHNRFGSSTPSDPHRTWRFGDCGFLELEQQLAADADAPMPAFTTSTYQEFQTRQLTELLTQYGPVAETWIDIPGVLGRGYREWLYHRIAALQPQTIVMMNSGIGTGEEYNVDYAWPSDLIAIERRLPPAAGHKKWRTIEGKTSYRQSRP